MEEIFLHIDMESRRSADWPEDVAAAIDRRVAADAEPGLAARALGLDVAALSPTTVDPIDLLGTWTLSRVVDDHLAGERREVVGTAELAEVEPGRVRWSESGTMTWPGHTVPVTRTLYVVREDDGWFVRFEDGRPFHPWAVGHQVDHPCAPTTTAA